MTTHTSSPSTARSLAAAARQGWAGLRVLLAFTVITGLVYPLVVTGIAQVAVPWRAGGSLLTAQGERTTDRSQAVGSALIGQGFTGAEWFHPRPSAAGDGWDTLASGSSQQGPGSPALITDVTQRINDVAALNGIDLQITAPATEAEARELGALVAAAGIPADAVTAGASGLDPHISLENAELQVPRVARARGLTEDQVREVVGQHTISRFLGVVGNPGVNVLGVNLALANLR